MTNVTVELPPELDSLLHLQNNDLISVFDRLSFQFESELEKWRKEDARRKEELKKEKAEQKDMYDEIKLNYQALTRKVDAMELKLEETEKVVSVHEKEKKNNVTKDYLSHEIKKQNIMMTKKIIKVKHNVYKLSSKLENTEFLANDLKTGYELLTKHIYEEEVDEDSKPEETENNPYNKDIMESIGSLSKIEGRRKRKSIHDARRKKSDSILSTEIEPTKSMDLLNQNASLMNEKLRISNEHETLRVTPNESVKESFAVKKLDQINPEEVKKQNILPMYSTNGDHQVESLTMNRASEQENFLISDSVHSICTHSSSDGQNKPEISAPLNGESNTAESKVFNASNENDIKEKLDQQVLPLSENSFRETVDVESTSADVRFPNDTENNVNGSNAIYNSTASINQSYSMKDQNPETNIFSGQRKDKPTLYSGEKDNKRIKTLNAVKMKWKSGINLVLKLNRLAKLSPSMAKSCLQGKQGESLGKRLRAIETQLRNKVVAIMEIGDSIENLTVQQDDLRKAIEIVSRTCPYEKFILSSKMEIPLLRKRTDNLLRAFNIYDDDGDFLKAVQNAILTFLRYKFEEINNNCNENLQAERELTMQREQLLDKSLKELYFEAMKTVESKAQEVINYTNEHTFALVDEAVNKMRLLIETGTNELRLQQKNYRKAIIEACLLYGLCSLLMLEGDLGRTEISDIYSKIRLKVETFAEYAVQWISANLGADRQCTELLTKLKTTFPCTFEEAYTSRQLMGCHELCFDLEKMLEKTNGSNENKEEIIIFAKQLAFICIGMEYGIKASRTRKQADSFVLAESQRIDALKLACDQSANMIDGIHEMDCQIKDILVKLDYMNNNSQSILENMVRKQELKNTVNALSTLTNDKTKQLKDSLDSLKEDERANDERFTTELQSLHEKIDKEQPHGLPENEKQELLNDILRTVSDILLAGINVKQVAQQVESCPTANEIEDMIREKINKLEKLIVRNIHALSINSSPSPTRQGLAAATRNKTKCLSCDHETMQESFHHKNIPNKSAGFSPSSRRLTANFQMQLLKSSLAKQEEQTREN